MKPKLKKVLSAIEKEDENTEKTEFFSVPKVKDFCEIHENLL